MWAQPIFVQHQQDDMSLLTTAATSTTVASASSSTHPTTKNATAKHVDPLSGGVIAGIVVGLVAMVSLVVGATVLYYRKRKRGIASSDVPRPVVIQLPCHPSELDGKEAKAAPVELG